ncbi:type IV pilin [Natronorubrum tibetense]|uniref:Flagellin domain-containing protein n=1 Tax=Natronorubrum tibetense GA33 TaxID=1114856 RepID=L9WA92_9EURY|nr:flagellin domain-containing protein [Natronorubrum tibetense GA33]
MSMDGKIVRNKLVGGEEERAVSPVIGVILMVAITVILAAVIAAFVLDLGDNMGSGSVSAGVSTDVSNSDEEVSITIDSMGDAEYFELRGDAQRDDLDLDQTGDSVTVSTTDTSGAEALLTSTTGDVNIVAIDGDSESVVSSFEWDWSDVVELEVQDDEVVVTLVEELETDHEVQVEDESGNGVTLVDEGDTESLDTDTPGIDEEGLLTATEYDDGGDEVGEVGSISYDISD